MLACAGCYNKVFTLSTCEGAAGSSYCRFFNEVGDDLLLRVNNSLLGQARALGTGSTLDPIAFPSDNKAYAQKALTAWLNGNDPALKLLTAKPFTTAQITALGANHADHVDVRPQRGCGRVVVLQLQGHGRAHRWRSGSPTARSRPPPARPASTASPTSSTWADVRTAAWRSRSLGAQGGLATALGARTDLAADDEQESPALEVRMTALSYANGTSTEPLLGETIGANLRRTAARVPDRDALVDVPTGRRWTYAELDAEVDTLARALPRGRAWPRATGSASGRPTCPSGSWCSTPPRGSARSWSTSTRPTAPTSWPTCSTRPASRPWSRPRRSRRPTTGRWSTRYGPTARR